MRFLISAWLTVSALCAQGQRFSDKEVERIHRSFLLIDTHNDVTSNTVKGFDIGKPSTTTQTDIPRLRKGNFDERSQMPWDSCET